MRSAHSTQIQSEELSKMSVEQDARLFGQHFEVGWCLGLLVARNVHKRAHARSAGQ